MFKKFKICLSAFIAAALTVSGTGCTIGKSTATAMTIDGYDVKAGVYIIYQNSALEDAKTKAQEANSELDTNDEEALKATKIDGMDFLEWVDKETEKKCLEHVTVNKKFDEMKLSIKDSDKEYVNGYADYFEEDNSNIYYYNGVGKESFKEYLTEYYKKNAIFDSIYGKDGSESIKDEDVKKYYKDNTARVKYVKLDLTDSDGNELDDSGKKEVKELADKYLKEVSDKKGDQLLEAFDDIKTEYDEYVAAKNSETTQGDDTSSETTETTVATTEAAAEDSQDSDESSKADKASTSSENEESSESSDVSEDTDSSAESEDEDSSDEETAETTAADSEDSETAETTVSTVPESETSATTETTTTPDPHANESLVSKVTTDKDTKEEDLNYTPCKKVHDWAFDSSTKNEAPEIIEDDTAYYVITKLDIEERMTEEDLWTEDRDSSIRHNMYDDEMDEKVAKWGEEYKKKGYKVNESAVNRYKPFDYKEPETTAAKQETAPMY